MSGAQDVVSLLRILDFDEDMLVLLDRNFKEIERLLGPLQVYEKLIGKQVNTSVQAAGITLDGVIPTASLSDKMVGLAHELQIASAAVVNAKMAVDAVKAMNIENGAVVADKIAANAVTAIKIEAGAVVADKIAANAVTAIKINVNELSAISANLGTVTSGTIDVLTDAGIGRYLNLNTQGLSSGVRFKYSANVVGEIYYDPSTEYLHIYGKEGIVISGAGRATSIEGYVTFSGAHSVAGLNTDTYSGNTGNATVAAHNHGIADGTKLAVDGGGYVTWVAYGGASHDHSMNHDHAVVKS